MTLPEWNVETSAGSAAQLHAESPPTASLPTLRLLQVQRQALTLGSTQADDVVDRSALRATETELVRRRSGGGAVLLLPGEHTWIDWWVPAGHPWFIPDVVAAARSFGTAWCTALGFDPQRVHEGGLEPGDWGKLVCFAGAGPGEVFDEAGRKVVGVSQRRTRDWLRVQTMVHHHWNPQALAPLLDLGPDSRARLVADLAGAVAEVPDGGDDLLHRLAAVR